jgi:GNAT superfamily N-acetyltransferase
VPASIALSDREDEETEKAVEDGLIAFNDAAAGPHGWRPLTLSVRRTGETEVAGGLIGRTFFGWLFVHLFYLPPDLRRQGLGTELLRRAEDEARARGCVGAHLDTFGWQARGFYEKQGYALFGTLPDFPPGQARFFLSKRLDAPPLPPA